MRYTNKFVEFLSGANTIKISGVRDFNSLNSLCKKVGLDMDYMDYYNMLNHAQRHSCAINNISILIEYQPCKGFTIGYRSIEDSAKWYGLAPWTMSEVLSSMK